MIWEGAPCLDGHDERLVEQFTAQVDELYRVSMSPWQHRSRTCPRYRAATSKHCNRIFQSALGRQVRQLLLAAEGRLKG
jgi:hypothetical protein